MRICWVGHFEDVGGARGNQVLKNVDSYFAATSDDGTVYVFSTTPMEIIQTAVTEQDLEDGESHDGPGEDDANSVQGSAAGAVGTEDELQEVASDHMEFARLSMERRSEFKELYQHPGMHSVLRTILSRRSPEEPEDGKIIKGLCWSPSLRCLASAGFDKSVTLWK